MRFRKGWGWLLLAALTVSTIGDEISLITLMFRTAGFSAPFAVPMLLVAQLLPALVATPFIGRLVDARDAGKLLAVAAVANAMTLSWMAYHPDLATTILGASVLGISFAIGGTATFVLIPVLATGLGMTLARGNAVLEFVRSAGMLAGPVAGGLLVAWGGTATALLVDAASFAILAVVVLGSGLRRPIPADTEGRTETLLAAYLPVLKNGRITVMIGSLTLGVFATAMADVAFVFLVTVSLGFGAVVFGVLTACWAGGMMAGAAASGTLPLARPAPVAFGAVAVMGATMLVVGIAGIAMTAAIIGVAIAFVIGGAANSVHNVAVRTMLQTEAPVDGQGKVAAVYSASASSAAILGYVAGGMFTPDHAVAAYVVGGVLGIVAGFVGWVVFGRVGREAG